MFSFVSLVKCCKASFSQRKSSKCLANMHAASTCMTQTAEELMSSATTAWQRTRGINPRVCLPSSFNPVNVRLCSKASCHFQSEELCCKKAIDCVSDTSLSQCLVQLENTRLMICSFMCQTLLLWTESTSGV